MGSAPRRPSIIPVTSSLFAGAETDLICCLSSQSCEYLIDLHVVLICPSDPAQEQICKSASVGVSGYDVRSYSKQVDMPKCSCVFGCRRQPNRKILCLECGKRVGPGCCLDYETYPCSGKGICRPCSNWIRDGADPRSGIGYRSCNDRYTFAPSPL